MTDKRMVRTRALPKRLSRFNVGLDRRRVAELARARASRLAKLRIPPLDLHDLPPEPWLRLTPMRPLVEGKGHLDFWDPSFVGINGVEVAIFDAAFAKQMPFEFEIVSPQLSLSTSSPTGKSLLEISVFAHIDGGAKPTFEIWLGNEKMTMTVESGKLDIISVVMHDWAGLRLAIPGQTNENLVGTGGSWAFYDLKVTPLP